MEVLMNTEQVQKTIEKTNEVKESTKENKRSAKKIKYNLSGHGQLTLYLYQYAEKLFEVVCSHNYDAKFNQTNQLGALKRVLPGAHYTRYEYILLQWYLIHELKQRKLDTGLGSNGSILQGFEVEGLDALTGGDLLQCLVLLTNMGHFPDTFSASRVWLQMLKNNTAQVRTGLFNGLEKSEKDYVRTILESNDVHKIHYANTLFMLRRMGNSPKSKPITNFASSLFLEYVNRGTDDLKKYWKTHSMIRNLAYIILDSSYAPIPLNIELASVISNMEQIFGINLNSNNPMTMAIKQLDKVLEDSVYLTGNSLIATAIRSDELENKFYAAQSNNIIKADGLTVKPEFHKSQFIRDILEPTKKDSNLLSRIFNEYSSYEVPSINWDTENVLEIKYGQVSNFSGMFKQELYNWEKELHQECGTSSCNVAIFSNPTKDHLRIVFSRHTGKTQKLQVSSLFKFIARIVDDSIKRLSSEYHNDEYRIENLKSIFEHVLKGVTNWGYEFTFEWQGIKNSSETPFFFGKGSKRIASRIDEYINKASPFVSDDMLHEFKCTREMLNSINYRGLILAYIGATKLWDGNSNDARAEFDGIVIFPNTFDDTMVTIIEGKNKDHGHTEARKQLTKRMKLLNDTFEYSLVDISTSGAYSCISFKSGDTE